MGYIVKYDNGFNAVALRRFNKIELNLFMSLCSVARDKGTNEITLTFDELKELSNYDSTTNTTRFIADVWGTYKKILSVDFTRHSNGKIEYFMLFTGFVIDDNNKKVTIDINNKFTYLLNNITSNFTRFELSEFVELKSTYSKECYRRLKQFRQTGKWIVTVEEFRRLLDIPESYRMSNIDQKVLEPILRELKPIFKGLKITKLTQKGRKITHIEFKFYKVKIEKVEDEQDILNYDWLNG